VDRPIEFRLTASTVMNAFYVPELAGMVYAMPGMQTKLNAVINHRGTFEGMSANYSGAGFSGMRFAFLGLSEGEFQEWVDTNRSGEALTRAAYLGLEKPSEREPVRRYGKVEQGLYEAVLNRCADGQQMCAHEMMAIDAAGGLGKGNIPGVRQSSATGRTVVAAAVCTPDNPLGLPAPAVAQ
jgi:cytochrome o ubiquinol oxidase subunit 2